MNSELKELKDAYDAAWDAYNNALDAASRNAYVVDDTNTAFKNAGNAYRDTKKAYVAARDAA